MTEQPVFGPADFVSIEGLEGTYNAEKETKSPETQVTVRISALPDRRYRSVTTEIIPGKKDKVETIEIGFVPLRDKFHLGVSTIPDAKGRLNFYILANFRTDHVELWGFFLDSENRENIDLKAILARHGLSLNKGGLFDRITNAQDGAPSPEPLRAFFMDVVEGAAPDVDLKKLGWKRMTKLVREH